MKGPLGAAAQWLRETLVIGPIRFYQRRISPGLPARCRFIPTCSAYAVTAIRRFGVFAGGLMALCRILRCKPWCRGGVDPVPKTFTLRPFAASHEPPLDGSPQD